MKDFYKGKTLDGKTVEVSVEDNFIVDVKEITTDKILPYICPPLVDLQHNGALGLAYNNMNEHSLEEMKVIANHIIRNGVGRVMATFTTAPYDLLTRAAENIGKVLCNDSFLNRLFCGIFHEGVFISKKAGWRGGHKPEFIIPPDWQKFMELHNRSGQKVKMVNIAPEEPNALDFISKAVAKNITVSIGHCCPDNKTVNEAVARGARMVTHFGNGAAPQIHRFQNPFWSFLANNELSLGIIGDGFHLPPELIKAVIACKGTEKCFMVSDANLYSGCKPGIYKRIGGCDCIIEKNGLIHLGQKELLAGAWFQNNKSVEFLINKVGLQFEDAWRLCSETPANLMGINLPQIKKGEEASFVLVDFKKNKLEIKQSVFLGNKYL